jgi:hypothetical protein
VSNILKSAALASVLMLGAATANAQQVIPSDAEDIGGDFRLNPGATWTVDYTVNSPDKFLLDLSFSGTGRRSNLEKVTFGLNSADQSYTYYFGNSVASAALGMKDTVEIDGPFSIVYKLGAAATAPVNVTFYGALTPVNVPEIGAEGGLTALLLVLGSVAVMMGKRREDGSAAA